MPHTARKCSESDYYHVVVKGIADQIIFQDDEDRQYYLQLLREAKELGRKEHERGVRLHAYCLMSNHVHLVLEASSDALATFMKYVHERYGTYYAKKTGRTGGVFRKPYWSEPIENDEYMLCAVRYVHANPAAAGVCAASAYEWSSARDYLGRAGITDTSMVLAMCGGRNGFIRFSKEVPASARAFPGSKLLGHISDDESVRIARLAVGDETLDRIVGLDKEQQIEALQALKRAGLTIRQIARVTGVGIRAVQHA